MTIEYKCTQCGSREPVVMTQKGSMKLQIILWFLFIIPGFFYSMWRATTKQATCAVCGSHSVTSKQILADYKPAIRHN